LTRWVDQRDKNTGLADAPAEGWLETCATLQMISQMLGKVRLARSRFKTIGGTRHFT
jgi:hypothetical protein